jgi:hypothetical protein
MYAYYYKGPELSESRGQYILYIFRSGLELTLTCMHMRLRYPALNCISPHYTALDLLYDTSIVYSMHKYLSIVQYEHCGMLCSYITGSLQKYMITMLQ